MFEVAGAKRIVSVDLHSGQIQGFFDGPVDHLTAAPVLVDWMAQNLPEDLVVVSPDAGRVKVAERYANQLHADLAIVHKRRVKGAKNQVEAKEVVGEVEGRTCVLIDDMIDTAGTIVAAAEQLTERGASAVYCAATHGVFSGPAIDRLKNAPIEKVVITNTLPLPPEKQHRQDRGALRRRHHRGRDRRGVRGHLGLEHLRRPEPELSGPSACRGACALARSSARPVASPVGPRPASRCRSRSTSARVPRAVRQELFHVRGHPRRRARPDHRHPSLAAPPPRRGVSRESSTAAAPMPSRSASPGPSCALRSAPTPGRTP